MHYRYQLGYTDNQVMPTMIGAVLLFVVLGQVTPAGLAQDGNSLKLGLFLLGATLVLLYGYAMHLYSLCYPESPFNRHSSPLFMLIVCGGVLGLAAWRFHTAGSSVGTLIYTALCSLVLLTSLGLSLARSKGGDE